MSKPQVFQFKVPDGVKPGEEIKMKFPGREEVARAKFLGIF